MAEQKIKWGKQNKYSPQYVRFWIEHPFCMVDFCGTEASPSHHVITRGAGGDDEHENLISLCAAHHREIHNIGNSRFCERHPEVADKIRAAIERKRNGGVTATTS